MCLLFRGRKTGEDDDILAERHHTSVDPRCLQRGSKSLSEILATRLEGKGRVCQFIIHCTRCKEDDNLLDEQEPWCRGGAELRPYASYTSGILINYFWTKAPGIMSRK